MAFIPRKIRLEDVIVRRRGLTTSKPKKLKIIKSRKIVHSAPKYSLVLSKYRPANIDPSLTNPSRVIHKALEFLGIDKKVIRVNSGCKGASGRKMRSLMGLTKNGSNRFWDRKEDFLWGVLDLAATRYKYELWAAHPDRGGSDKRMAQINESWDIVRGQFAKRGYILHGMNVKIRRPLKAILH
jgi:hypothetical protein